MIRQIFKASVMVAASAIAVPYCMAFIANVLHGWPLGKHKFRRAFHPSKVYALSYAILQQQINYIRFTHLYFRWKRFYQKAHSNQILKDIHFNDGKQCLDLYRPLTKDGSPLQGSPVPVILFIYGGTWSSGDKDMYPLLCSQMANVLKAVVCCPNYSFYPTGYVDDMVQDIVDCLRWIQKNIHIYNGDQDRIMLIGHSAGGHLVSLVTLELAMKQLMENPDSMLADDDDVSPSMSVSRQVSGIHFDEVYFNENGTPKDVDQLALSEGAASGDQLHSSSMTNPLGSSGSSFLFIQPDQTKDKYLSGQSSMLIVSESDITENLTETDGNEEEVQNKSDSSDTENGAPLKFETEKSTVDNDIKPVDKPTNLMQGAEAESDDSSDEEDKITVEEVSPEESIDVKLLTESGNIELSSAFELAQQTQPGDTETEVMSHSQREARGLLSAIRVVVGLAGVYNIGEHFKFEYWRGVEDVSKMARAMFGPEHFDRLSPTVIVQSLPKNTRLPAFHLIHGSVDKTVPVESSNKFCAALSNMGCKHVYMTEIPECGHYDVCMDLMDPKRKYYNSVMAEIMGSVQKFLN